MANIYFDMTDPFEKDVCERLNGYMSSGYDHDSALEMIGRDFPYMDTDVQDHCNSEAFSHYCITDDGKLAASMKRMLLLHEKFMGEPFNSHVRSEFHISEGEKLVIAVMLENPMYLYENAGVNITFHINGKKVNEVKHTIDMMDRRNVYYVPVDLHQNEILSEGKKTTLLVEVFNEEVPGQVLRTNAEIYHGEMTASEVFTVESMSIVDQNDCESDEGLFCIEEVESLGVNVELECNDFYGEISNLEGIFVISPSDAVDKKNDVICPVNLSGLVSGSDRLEGNECLFKTLEFLPEGSLPTYKLQPGKYVFSFFIWGTLLWSEEFQFVAPSDDIFEEESAEEDADKKVSRDELRAVYDALVDDFMEELDAVPVNHESGPVTDVGDASEFFEVVGLQLFNVDNDCDDNECCLDNMSRFSQTSFAADKLKMLAVVGRLNRIKSTVLLDIGTLFKWAIYDQTGRMQDLRPVKIENKKNEVLVCSAFGDFCGQKWEQGTYRVELQWQKKTVISAVFTVGDIDVQSDYDPNLISRKQTVVTEMVAGEALARLDKLVGLKKVKEKIRSLMSSYKFLQLRAEAGLPTKQPALHARFLGNPGTGKTTVARLLGQIYKEMGLLSSGHVVLEERKNLIGRYYDSEGLAVQNALNRAKGGILLIDEAYNLYVPNDDKDPGRRILEYLLTALADENNRDWMLILAGYPKETTAMLKSNPGIDSRVSEVFEFEDLSVDDLLQIAELYCEDNQYELSEGACERLKAIITRDLVEKGENFGNGRYVNKMMDMTVNTRMASRLSNIFMPTYDQLITIEAEDIPIDPEEAERITSGCFDDKAIDDALRRLDSLVGLTKVKSAIHNFVKVSRYLHSQGDRFRGKGLLKWNFTGNTGTGKSTVAQILTDILKGMNLVQNNELTEIKGEEIFNVSDYVCNEIIRGAVKKSRKGVLFIDGDAPEFRSSDYRLTSEQIRFKLAALASEDNASGALIISECSSSNLSIAHSLASNGIYDFDHTFIFDDYTEEELYEILVQCLEKQDTRLSDEAEPVIREYIRNLCANRELSFANARTMKNLSRAIFEMMILRISKDAAPESERVVLADDVESFVWKRLPGKIGFSCGV